MFLVQAASGMVIVCKMFDVCLVHCDIACLVFCIMFVCVLRMSSLIAPLGLVSEQSASDKQFNEMLSLEFV